MQNTELQDSPKTTELPTPVITAVRSSFQTNPFKAIQEIASPDDVKAVAQVLTNVASWQFVDSETFLSDLLVQVHGLTGIAVEYGYPIENVRPAETWQAIRTGGGRP